MSALLLLLSDDDSFVLSFIKYENLLNQITNVDLANSLGV